MQEVGSGFWLSPGQADVWLAGERGWNCNSIGIFELQGSVGPDDLPGVLAQIAARHEVLRTVFRRPPGLKVPFQMVLPTSVPVLENLAEGSLEEVLSRERNRRFDFENGPAAHFSWISFGQDRSALVLTVPSVLSDARSLGILANEIGLMLAGRANELPEAALTYVQFAQWQRDLLETEDDDSTKGKDFWKKSAAAASPVPVLPQENAAAQGNVAETYTLALENSLFLELQAIAKTLEVTLPDILLAAWQSLIWRLTGQREFRVNVSFHGREYPELAQLPGLIAKDLPVPARFEEGIRFSDFVRQVHEAGREAAGWQEYYAPEDRTAEEPSLAFEYAELDSRRIYGAIALRMLHQESWRGNFKLKFSVQGSADQLSLTIQFDPARLPRASVERWGSYMVSLLAAVAADPRRLVSQLPLLGREERQTLLVDWNRTEADYPRGSSIHELFEAQVARTPERPAVRSGMLQLSYRELNERANQLAHALRAMGSGPDSLVGLCLDRSCDMAIALMAILKSGGAYVPLSADQPKSRLGQQIAGARLIVTESKFLERLPDFDGRVLCLDRDADSWSAQPRTNPEPLGGPDNLVYIIYTSGSTGTPKGVAVRHRNLVNYSWFIRQWLELERYPEGLHFATVSTLGADLGNTCIYPSLISGGCLHIIDHDVAADGQRFREYAAAHPIDVLKIVPSHLAALLDAGGRDVLPKRYLVLGGEALTRQLVSKIVESGADCELMNHYGPTETTVGSLTLRLKSYDWRNSRIPTIPIGRPIANTRVYILDENREPVPTGVIGELYIAGDGVTAGYLNQPERTAERFVPDPFGPKPEARMYRTGDMVRYLADGNVEFLGRADDQVKIRGFRIELGEVEAALSRHPSVKQAVVLVREDEGGDKRLVAYVVGRNEGIDLDRLRAHLKNELPDYMTPAAIVSLPKIPMNANGKIDRQALPAPEHVTQGRPYIAPRTATEASVAAVWETVLRRGQVGVDDDFFEMGGHSLLATQIASRLRDKLKVPVAVRLLFDHTTVGALAAALDNLEEESDDDSEMEIIPISRR